MLLLSPSSPLCHLLSFFFFLLFLPLPIFAISSLSLFRFFTKFSFFSSSLLWSCSPSPYLIVYSLLPFSSFLFIFIFFHLLYHPSFLYHSSVLVFLFLFFICLPCLSVIPCFFLSPLMFFFSLSSDLLYHPSFLYHPLVTVSISLFFICLSRLSVIPCYFFLFFCIYFLFPSSLSSLFPLSRSLVFVFFISLLFICLSSTHNLPCLFFLVKEAAKGKKRTLIKKKKPLLTAFFFHQSFPPFSFPPAPSHSLFLPFRVHLYHHYTQADPSFLLLSLYYSGSYQYPFPHSPSCVSFPPPHVSLVILFPLYPSFSLPSCGCILKIIHVFYFYDFLISRLCLISARPPSSTVLSLHLSTSLTIL